MIPENDCGRVFAGGVLEIQPDGHGFLRSVDSNYYPLPDDVYVSSQLIAAYCAKTGDFISGPVSKPGEGTKHFSLVNIDALNFGSPVGRCSRIEFDDLKKVNPCERLRMETTPENLCGRIMDLLIPLGKGQHIVVAGSAHNGQQLLFENVANSLAINHPEVEITTLLIGKDPEEATALRRSLRGEVIFSTSEESTARHVQLAELVLHKAKRRVEYGHDAVVLLDSMTSLFRAYEKLLSADEVSHSGEDSPALIRSQQFSNAAGNTGEGGSLTLVAILDTEACSPAERSFADTTKAAAHVKIVIDRTVARHGILPAVNIHRSTNRNEELLIPAKDFSRISVLRRVLAPLSPAEAVKLLGGKMLLTHSNTQLLDNMSSL